MILPEPNYEHLLSLVDGTGIFEHCLYTTPRLEHGYTVDDAARALIILCDAPHQPRIDRAMETLLAFVLDAMRPDGRFHNRRGVDGRWRDEVGSDDAHGRALWALGVTAVAAPQAGWRDAARSAFRAARLIESPHLRPYAYLALGAQRLLSEHPADDTATAALEKAADMLDRPTMPWPEPRLTYANGRVPDALLAIGQSLGRDDLVERGLAMLAWLVDVETQGDWCSFTPVGGWRPGEARPRFDQQPIEADALASATARAWRMTRQEQWRDATERAWRWLIGHNDSGTALYDPGSGGCRDGLTANGANENRGAESTIAALSVLSNVHRVRDDSASRRPVGLVPEGGTR